MIDLIMASPQNSRTKQIIPEIDSIKSIYYTKTIKIIAILHIRWTYPMAHKSHNKIIQNVTNYGI